MPKFLFSNNASSVLASGITNVATSIFLNTGDGALFPSPGADEQFPITLKDSAGNIEVAYCTSRSGDTLTVTRGEEGTTAQAFDAGDVVGLRITKGVLESFMQSFDNIEAGTKATFIQASAPTGWTQDVSANDRVIRMVSGSGGGTGGSWTISGISVQGHTLTNAEIPSHNHNANTNNTGGHRHGLEIPDNMNTGKYSPIAVISRQVGSSSNSTSFTSSSSYQQSAGNHSHNVSVGSTGGGGSHSHGLTIGSSWRPSYIDAIVCSKD